MPSLGPLELGVILFIVVLLFGAKQLPKLGKGVGETIRELKKAANMLTEEVEETKTVTKKAVDAVVKK